MTDIFESILRFSDHIRLIESLNKIKLEIKITLVLVKNKKTFAKKTRISKSSQRKIDVAKFTAGTLPVGCARVANRADKTPCVAKHVAADQLSTPTEQSGQASGEMGPYSSLCLRQKTLHSRWISR